MKNDLSKSFFKKELIMLAIHISDTIITGLACFGLFIGFCRFFISNAKDYNISDEFIVNTEALILGSAFLLITSTVVYHIHKSDAKNINKDNN